ncbi:hypothetical protein C7974DRAFT_27001 [Boeremia exigua]|uniref:uncharacterized protein n=1 Tax=Boeremia exigua TaxID=749465 RepID=UPI001E8EAE5D|nr:uncharacterized protein C7974DRAFT_27001 [Boeremia exigua]KAH6644737.1 hypothetical protein C7974DRAFT_27001 [Boeremia exigua]
MKSPQIELWKYIGLQADRARCLEAVQATYEGYHVKEFGHQGHCSFTLILSPRRSATVGVIKDKSDALSETNNQLIVQIRAAQHSLDLDTAAAARRAHPSLAPVVRAAKVCLPGYLKAYEMNTLEGVPFSRLQACLPSTRAELRDKQKTLIINLANIIAQSWPVRESRRRRDSVLRPEPLATEEQTFLSQCRGKVGSRIVQKLEELSEKLPDQWLRERARATLDKLRKILDYPVVLNHGDLIPSNILVNEETWQITGLVDWAEAEWLPFGTCLYGLEHLLGRLQRPSQDSQPPNFVYYANAPQLREAFWTSLAGLIPELRGSEEGVRIMRDAGVFLWHGYAWDDGAIDRVVDEVNDSEELAKLRAFLSV